MPPISHTLLSSYENAAAGWYSAIYPITLDIFWALAAITFLFLAIRIALGGLSDETWSNLVWLLISISLAQVVIMNANTWSVAFINTFIFAGEQATQLPGLDPGTVLEQGIAVARLLLLPLGVVGSLSSPLIAVCSFLAALCVLIAFTLISALLLVTLVEVQFVTTAGILLLGFLGNNLTKGIAEKYFGYLVAVSVHLLMFYLVLGAGVVLTRQWLTVDIPNAGFNIDAYLNVFCGGLLFGVVAWRVPSKASALLSGGIAVSIAEFTNMAATAATSGRLAAPVAKPIAAGIVKAGTTARGAALGAAGMVAGAAHAAVMNKFRGNKP